MRMQTLHELQSDFLRFIAGEASPDLLATIDGDGFDPVSLLSIYRNNTLITLTETLSATYPVVRRLVNQRFFAYAAHTFIFGNFPSTPCLVEYGAKFPAFLADFPPAAGIAYLSDVASLEWAINRVVHSATESAVAIDSIAGVGSDPAEIRLHTDPATRYVASIYPIHQIWRANQPDVDPGVIHLEGNGEHLQIRRTDGLQIRHLLPASWTFRAVIAEGGALGTAVESALEIDTIFDLSTALAALFDEYLVVGFDTQAAPF
jgi:Putative DNA-binding domain